MGIHHSPSGLRGKNSILRWPIASELTAFRDQPGCLGHVLDQSAESAHLHRNLLSVTSRKIDAEIPASFSAAWVEFPRLPNDRLQNHLQSLSSQIKNKRLSEIRNEIMISISWMQFTSYKTEICALSRYFESKSHDAIVKALKQLGRLADARSSSSAP